MVGAPYKFADSVQRAHDSIRFLQINKAKFSIDQVAGVIYNRDSFPYGTVLRNKVQVTSAYHPTYGAASVKVIIPDSINGFTWNNSDSLNFSKTPITFVVTSLGGATKSYNIDIRIHKIDPDTIPWKQMESYPTQSGASKTLLVNDETFYTYAIENGSVMLYNSNKSALSWQQKTVSGLPATVKPHSIFRMNDVFYAALDNGDSYKSNDGENWAKVNNDKFVNSILGILPAANRSDDLLLVIIKETDGYYFGKTKDMSSIETVSYLSYSPTDNKVPSTFPLQDEGSFTNFSSDKNTRMLVVGGGLNAGTELNYVWFIRNTAEGLEMTPSVKNSLFKGAISLFSYDSSLYALHKNQFYISKNWGEGWVKAPNKQRLDPLMTQRSGESVVVDNENNIWIFGGMSTAGSYLNDVWKGRLNKLNP